MSRRAGLALQCACVMAVSAVSIAQVRDRPAFDVTSVKRSTSDDPSYSYGPQPNGFNASRAPVVAVIQYAYDVPVHRVEGGPAWIHSDRFDVTARSETTADVPTVRLMLQTLLEQRFRLVVRTDTREMDRLALRQARADGRLGPRLERLGDACDSPEVQARINGRPFPTVPPGSRLAMSRCSTVSDIARVIAGNRRMDVVDRTSLSGVWSYTFFYAPDTLSTGVQESSNPDLQTFTDALRDQLGLALVRERGPVEMLMIQSIEPPSEN